MEQNVSIQEFYKNILNFYQLKKHIKYFGGTTRIYLCKSSGMSEEDIENITKSNSLFAPTFVNHYILPDVNFNRHCLINKNIFIPKK